jgi:hypothetical protein
MALKIIAPGTRFSQWLVLGEAPHTGTNFKSFVRCACGQEQIVNNSRLLNGSSTRCKLCRHESLIGKTFGYLTVVGDAAPEGGDKSWRSICVCACSPEKQKTVSNPALKKGLTTSCGCRVVERASVMKLRHGASIEGNSKFGTYRSWHGAKSRCYTLNSPNYKHYGGRGITMCDRWKNSFDNFFEDMGYRPTGMTLERIDNEGNYEPGNCKWATTKEQNCNKRTNKIYTIRGKKDCLTYLCKYFGISCSCVRKRLHKGWSPEDAFLIPPFGTQQFRQQEPEHQGQKDPDFMASVRS